MITISRVIELFNELNTFPRESGNRRPVCNYLCEFAKRNGLEYYIDDEYNVVIRKEASVGMETAPSLILQAHSDMVCVKDEDSTHDFNRDPIESYIEDGFLKAKGTTLGADNGIAVAIILAFLESNTKKPTLECVITSDEETNMTGAKHLDKSILNSKYMINLDEETEKSITVSSAGISDLRLGYEKESITESYDPLEKTILNVVVDGLYGGHSGIDIKLNRVSSIKVICDFVEELIKNKSVEIIDIKAGSHMNAIPKDASLVIAVLNDDLEKILKLINEYSKQIKEKYIDKEPNFRMDVSVIEETYTSKLKDSFVDTLLNVIKELPSGAISYDKEIKELVETSANIGRIVSDDTNLKIWISIRSSVNEKLDSYIDNVKAISAKYGAVSKLYFKEYGWPVNTKSKLVPFLMKIKEDLKHEIPKVSGIHAGLECGTFSRSIENADICAMGPNIMHPHTTGEKAEIKSIEKFIVFLKEALNRFDEIE